MQKQRSIRTADLFEPPARARNADPATSHAAAARVDEFSTRIYGRIVASLRNGSGTFHEVAARACIEPAQAHKRLPELERMNLVRITDDVRRGPSGRLCRVWSLADGV